MKQKCPKCNGSGDMGFTAPVRCNVCSGTGMVELSKIDEKTYLEKGEKKF